MGNATSQKAAEQAKHRRYSRTSGYSHWMDNIKDKKLLKINLKQTSDSQGTFTLLYTDDSSDDFLNLKSNFTFTGRYQHLLQPDEREAFGVIIPVTARGAVLVEGATTATAATSSNDLHKSKPPNHKGSTDPFVASSKDAADLELFKQTINNTTTKMTRFFTEKIVCKLTEGTCVQSWTIVQSTQPDCIETAPADIVQKVSWPWSGVDGAKLSHQAPPGTLDFVGEESFEPGGASSIDLKIRIPQLAAGHNPPVVCLNEVGGWKLGKKSIGLT
jgi:hypothetical protein